MTAKGLLVAYIFCRKRRGQIMRKTAGTLFCVVLMAIALPLTAHGGDADLAQQLANPVASLISVPFQFNYDAKVGPEGNGWQWKLNFQPVIPFSLSEEWNLISRTILPVLYQKDVIPGGGYQLGPSDTLQSLFFSPAKPTSRGVIWGLGPALLFPTGTENLLSGRKWGAGPTGVILVQSGPWTYGVLSNHIWSYAGDNSRPCVNSTFIQPFIAYVTKTSWTFTLNSESTYDWRADQWTIPVNGFVSKLVKFGKQPVSFGAGARYWMTTPETGPGGWGARFIITFLFPKGTK
jgi:hypothetical protein